MAARVRRKMQKVEQRNRAHFERVLFVVGNQNSGKSTLLRSMFVDVRFGRNRHVPGQGVKIIPTFALSNERGLKVRLTSPHETHETLDVFFRKIDREMERAWNSYYYRFNFACSLQPTATSMTPDVVIICREFQRRFQPERIRVVQIHPMQDGSDGQLLTAPEVDQLRGLGIEVVTIDAHRSATSDPNGLFLADFFDFA
jgi:hypothetical protein